MEHKKFRELVGYKIVPLNSEVSCQAPQDACEDCALCIYDYLHYEKIGPDGKCDSERHQEKMIQEQKRSLALQINICNYVSLALFVISLLCFWLLPKYVSDHTACVVGGVLMLAACVACLTGLGKLIHFSKKV